MLTSFGAGFTNSSGLKLLRDAAIIGAVDASFDYNLNGSLRTILDKNVGETISDFAFGTLGGLEGGVFNSPSKGYNILGRNCYRSGNRRAEWRCK